MFQIVSDIFKKGYDFLINDSGIKMHFPGRASNYAKKQMPPLALYISSVFPTFRTHNSN